MTTRVWGTRNRSVPPWSLLPLRAAVRDGGDPADEVTGVEIRAVARVPVEGRVHVVAEGREPGGETAGDRVRGVGVLGAEPDPPVPGAVRVTLLGEVVHGVHQVELG